MSYMEQTCPHSSAFGYRPPRKARNVSWFIEIVIGVAVCCGIFAVICMIGGCLGCEACFECAATYDDCFDCESSGCSLEENVRNCNEQSDDCVSCEGVDCFGREGCFACDGKWDCSDCSGEVYYQVTLNTGDESTTLKMKGGTKRLSIDPYNSDRPVEYFTFKGYYNKAIGGTKYIDEDGNIVKDISGDIKLYAQYEEENQGEDYVIHFITTNPETGSEYFPAPSATTFYVGEPSSEFPDYEHLDNFVFKGWYTLPNGNGKLIYGPNDYQATEDFVLHLSDFNKNPLDSSRVLSVYAHYTNLEYDVTFHFADGQIKTETVNSGTKFGTVAATVGTSSKETYECFGWSYNAKEWELTASISSDFEIVDNLDVYELVRKKFTFTFNYKETTSTGAVRDKSIKITKYEGQTFTFNEDEQLLNIQTSDSLYKGWRFVSWKDQYGQTKLNVYVSATESLEFTAQYQEVSYNVTYWIIMPNGTERDVTGNATADSAPTTYKYGNGLSLWICPDIYGTFVGWCEKADLSDAPKKTLSESAFGDKKLYAKFR